jgi:hypothetical protein
MNSQEPFKISNIEFNKIVYPKNKSNDKKKIIYMKYNDKGKLKNFVFQTPTLLNINKSQMYNGYNEIELALVGKEKDKVKKFVNFLNELENKVKSDAQFNASSWFNITDENQTINFQKIIRESEDFPTGTIKIKIIKNNDFETLLQLNNSKRIGVDAIPDDSWSKMILECYAVWINSNNDFGIFLRPVLISFTPKEKEVYNYTFLEDSDEDNETDVPDTDVTNNIFMRVDAISKSKNTNANESTSQLEINDLLRKLESDSVSVRTSEQDPPDLNMLNKLTNINVLQIDLGTKLSSSENSDDEYQTDSEVEKSPNIDAETSDNDINNNIKQIINYK